MISKIGEVDKVLYMSDEQTPQNMQPLPEIFGEPPYPVPDLSRLRAEFAASIEEEEDEFEDGYEDDGHPSWYEPTQCSMCDNMFMPSNEEACYCDDCEVKLEKD